MGGREIEDYQDEIQCLISICGHFPFGSVAVDEETRALQTDEINAYTYTYPVSVGRGKNLSW
jgi:hypothetical protein